MADNFDALAAELDQVNLILNKGVHFTVPKRSLLRFLGKPDRRFELRQPTAGTLVYLCRELLNLEFEEDAIKADAFAESKRLMAVNVGLTGRIVAIMVLQSKWKIRLLLPFMADYFLWRITPEKLLQLSQLILTMANIPDFINSTRYLSIQKRVTAPALVEKLPEVADQDED